MLDIGAGTGALTARLVRAGGRVVAIELHPGRARELRKRFGPSVIVVEADATDLRLPRRPFRVVANPPFGVITAVLRRLVSPRSRLLSADLVVPAFTAARWAGGRGPGAARWSRLYDAQVRMRVPAAAFHPPAPAAASVLRIERRAEEGLSSPPRYSS